MAHKSQHKVRTIKKLRPLRQHIAKWRSAGETVALVPTMGALHAGHIALVKKARKKADRVVVSIFVNPGQFAPNEDLDRYPRDLAGDLEQLADIKTDLVWAPSVDEMYGAGFSTQVTPGSASEGLESDFRPHFFAGVTTVCCKLFLQVAPDFAIFGEKDYQQLCVIRQMVRDLDIPLKIVGAPTVRERDGLALSSRNAYLSKTDREAAPQLNATLKQFATNVANGRSLKSEQRKAETVLLKSGFKSLDYIEIRDAETLAPWSANSGQKGRALVAAWLGKTRLIDNIPVTIR